MSGQLLISHSDSEYPYQDSEPDPATRSHIHEAGYKSQNHLYLPLPLLPFYRLRGLTLSGTKTHVKQRFLPLTPLLMVSDDLWSPVLPA